MSEDGDTFEEGVEVGRVMAMRDVLNVIETGCDEGFDDGEILDAVRAAAGQAVDEWERDEPGEWEQ